MSDDALSQEEFDALLRNGGEDVGSGGDDLHALWEALRLSLWAAAGRTAQMAGQELTIDLEESAVRTFADFKSDGAANWLAAELDLSGSLEGLFVLLFPPDLADSLGRSVAGTDETGPHLDLDTLEGCAEALEVFAQAFGEQLAKIIRQPVAVRSGPPAVIDIAVGARYLPIGATESFWACELRIALGTLEPRRGYLLIPVDVQPALTATLSLQTDAAVAAAAEPQRESLRAASSHHLKPGRPVMSAAADGGPLGKRPVQIEPAEFEPLVATSREAASENIDLLLDVPLEITVELGRSHMQIREILSLAKGQVVELDKLAGEPVDVFVNGKLMAKGEVVVMDENFGVKIISIVSRRERVQNLG